MLISNSEIKTFQTCQRRHYYSFRESLAPDSKNLSKALTRGIVGHEALEEYYRAKRQGNNKAWCTDVLLHVIDQSLSKYAEFTKELTQLKDVLKRYVDCYWDEPWKVLEVEKSYETLLDNSRVDLKYGMRLDLLVEITAGKDKGQIVVVDHKFVYDFFSDRHNKMNAQLIKYMKTLRDNGIDVRKGILNQIRYRELKNPDSKKIFRRDTIVSSNAEMQRYMNEHAKVAKDIWEMETAPIELTRMNIDKMTCGYCSFQPLCSLYMSGLDTEATKKHLYVRNEYAEQYQEEDNAN